MAVIQRPLLPNLPSKEAQNETSAPDTQPPAKIINGLLEIRESSGKGLGVFARCQISPGTVLLKESPILLTKISLTTHNIDQDREMREVTYLEHSFSRLQPSERLAFMELSQGTRTFATPRLRIYKNNAFTVRREEGCYSGIYLNKSRLNHSCLPNVVDDIEEITGVSTLLASHAIAPGEEVSICYWYYYDMMTASQRKSHQNTIYGFTCSCKACNPETEFQNVSDDRRKTMSHLWWSIKGKNEPDLSIHDWTSDAQKEESRGRRNQELEPQPLLQQDRYKYISLLAQLMESEGLISQSLCEIYLMAIVELKSLVDPKNSNTGQSLQLSGMAWARAYIDLREWKRKLVRTAKICHDPYSDEATKFQDQFENLRAFLWLKIVSAGDKIDLNWAKANNLDFGAEQAAIMKKMGPNTGGGDVVMADARGRSRSVS